MSSSDEQPVTETPTAVTFEVHLRANGTAANVFRIQCHDFRETARFLEFLNADGDAVGVFPASEVIAAVRIEAYA